MDMRSISLVIACALMAACGSVDLVRPGPTESSAVPLPSANTPVPVPVPTIVAAAPTAPAGFARVLGTVTDSEHRPVVGADIAFEPFAVLARTDASGRFEVLVPVGAPGCAWTSLEVRVLGYGTYTRVDEPLSAGVLWWDPVIQRGTVRQFVGAPRAHGNQEDQGFCQRGTWVGP